RRAFVLLAVDPGAERHPRLSRRTRSGASCRDEPFGEVLAAGAAPLPASRTRQGMARRARQRSASLRLAGGGWRDQCAVIVATDPLLNSDGCTSSASFVATAISVTASTTRSAVSGIRAAAWLPINIPGTDPNSS